MIPWMGNMTFFLEIVGEEDYPLCVHLSLAFMLHGLILAKGKDLIVQSHVLSSRSPEDYGCVDKIKGNNDSIVW